MKKFLIIFLSIFIIIILDGFLINPKGFKIIETPIRVDNLNTAFEGFKIAQISDVLIGSTKSADDLKPIVKKINEAKPDIIIFTGDLTSDGYKLNETEIKIVKEQLKSLECSLTKYAVLGDNDSKQLEVFQEIMKESDFVILDNDSLYQFNKDNTPIKISGVTTLENVDKSLEIVDNLDVSLNIVLTHYPDYSEELSNHNVDIIFAGHSLKGQIRIPFIGGLLKKENAENYLDGQFKINNTQVFVSGGLGTEKIAFRLFNKPEVNIYRLIAN